MELFGVVAADGRAECLKGVKQPMKRIEIHVHGTLEIVESRRPLDAGCTSLDVRLRYDKIHWLEFVAESVVFVEVDRDYKDFVGRHDSDCCRDHSH